jgi:carbonic anhydrase
MVEKGEIGIIGAMYNIETGVVEFYVDSEFIKDELTTDLALSELTK